MLRVSGAVPSRAKVSRRSPFPEHRGSDEAAFAHRDHAAVARGLGHARADRALIERLAHQDDAFRSVERHGSGMLGIDRGEQAAQVVDLDAADHDTGKGAVRVRQAAGEHDHPLATDPRDGRRADVQSVIVWMSDEVTEVLGLGPVEPLRHRAVRAGDDDAFRVEEQQEGEARCGRGAVEQDQLAQFGRRLCDVSSAETVDDRLQGQVIEFDVASDIATEHLHEAVRGQLAATLRVRAHLPEQKRGHTDQAGDGEEVGKGQPSGQGRPEPRAVKAPWRAGPNVRHLRPARHKTLRQQDTD